MEQRNTRVYETYRLNLDNTRLFGISLVLLVALGLAFLAGLFLGKVSARSRQADAGPEPPGSATMALFSNMAAATQVQGYDFYRALPKERLTPEDLVTSIPSPKMSSPRRAPVSPLVGPEEADASSARAAPAAPSGETEATGTMVATTAGGDGATAASQGRRRPRPPIRDDAPVRRLVRSASSVRDAVTDDAPRRPSRPSETAAPAAKAEALFVQVASFREMPAAEALEHRLRVKSYPVRIVKAKINGSRYYRVRVGPYASRVEAEATLKRLREREGFAAAYIAADR